MLGLFKRSHAALDAAELGHGLVALALRDGCTPPAGCQALIVDAGGHARRAAPGKRIELRAGEQAWAWHPGPYAIDLLPFAQAPETGLRTAFAIDAEPGGARQRFELLLAAEACGRLELAALAQALEAALQRELAQGALELPPCTTIDEWNAFRQGLNQLLYMRFGLTVDDCVPVDLGETRDYAALLAARAVDGGAGTPMAQTQAPIDADPDSVTRIEPVLGPPCAPGSLAAANPACRGATGGDPADAAVPDARALRRLFLELPSLMCGLRLAALPADQDQFRRQQALLRRLDLLCVSVNSMPALGLAAPGQPLDGANRLRRARHSRRACASLDEAWALLARCNGAADQALAGLYDEAERIVANLEADCGARRLARADRSDRTDHADQTDPCGQDDGCAGAAP